MVRSYHDSLVYMLTSLEECLAQIGQPAGEQSQGENSHFRQIFALKDVHLLAVFILVYVGVEVTLGGTFVMASYIFCAMFTMMFRLDCHICHRCPWGWSIVWVYIIRIFWRYAASMKSLARSYLYEQV